MASVKAEYIGTTTARFTPDKKAISKVCEAVSKRINKNNTEKISIQNPNPHYFSLCLVGLKSTGNLITFSHA